MSTSETSELALVRAAIRLLRKADTAPPADRTGLLRQVADLLVDLRATYTDSDGQPDWRGKSFAYRDAVRDIYNGAGLPRDSSATKTALRYHVGNALRDRLTQEELEQAGLSLLDPRDRQAARRAESEEASPLSPDAIIASLSMLARRLDETVNTAKVTDHDLARLRDATDRLTRWLQLKS